MTVKLCCNKSPLIELMAEGSSTHNLYNVVATKRGHYLYLDTAAVRKLKYASSPNSFCTM